MSPVTVVITAAALMMLVERLRPGVVQPEVPHWIARVVAFSLVQMAVVLAGAVTWDRWLPSVRLADGAALGPVGGALAGYVAITFVFYWWHRARHEVPWLWRHLHQVHHSPARVEVAMSFYKHPLEIAANGVLSSAVLHVACGLPPATAATVVAMTGVAELVYHWNVRTPHWLGYLFQRPEMHRRHHQRDWHRGNYADLPVWDLLFGTFDNPREVPAPCGFAGQRELRLVALLLGAPHRSGVDTAAHTTCSSKRWRDGLVFAFLVALGCMQMAGDVLGAPRLKALGAATQVAPAMRVFTAHERYETHAVRFTLHWQARDGRTGAIVLDPTTYRDIEGPYNRRNVYGAALAYAPLLRADARTRAMQQGVMRYAFCIPGALRPELHVPADAWRFALDIAPRRADARRDLELTFAVDCHE